MPLEGAHDAIGIKFHRAGSIALLPPGLLLWTYLKSIHWIGLFQESAMEVSGLVFLFLAALILAIAVLLPFIVPSMFLISAIFVYPQDQVIPKEVINVYRFAMAGWFVGVSITTYFDNAISVLVALSLTFFTALTFVLLNMRKLNIYHNGLGWLAISVRVLGLSSAASFTIVTTSLPLLVILKVAKQIPDIEDWQSWVVFGGCVVISFVSLIPGILCLNTRTTSVSFYRSMKFLILGACFVFYVVIFIAASFVPISSTVLRLSGIYSDERVTFQILNPTLAAALMEVGLPVTKRGMENGTGKEGNGCEQGACCCQARRPRRRQRRLA